MLGDKSFIKLISNRRKVRDFSVKEDIMYQTPEGFMEVRIQHVKFSKQKKSGDMLTHDARIITYVDVHKHKLVSLLTNDLFSEPNEIIAIYRKRWEIELLFKQIKQNFPLKYFYGESANAIKIQIWGTLIANLLLMVLQKRLKRRWSFSGLATMMIIALMYYVDFYSLFNNPEKDWIDMLKHMAESPPQLTIFD
jgi:IS4 transposase